MSDYGPISKINHQYEDFAGFFLKGFLQGTTTPLSMATDQAAGTLLAKAEINTQGFIKTAGGVLFIPYFNQAYDLFLFPTAAEADANDTANAIQMADNIISSPNVATFETEAALALTSLSAGQYPVTKGEVTAGDGLGAQFFVVTSQALKNGDVLLANGNVAVLQSGKSKNTNTTITEAASSFATAGMIFDDETTLPVHYFANGFAQNAFFTTGGSLLNGAASGTKDGSNVTAFGLGNFLVATTTFASDAFGFNSCNDVTTGDSIAAFGYQTASRATTAKNIACLGTDAGFNITTGNDIVCIGRHTLFDGSGATDFIGTDDVFIGTDIGLLATNINDCVYIGDNCGLNALTSTSCNVIGSAAARDAPAPSQSNIMGATACQAVTTLLEVVTLGDRAVQNSLSDTQSVNIGADCFFTAAASAQTNISNVGVGYQSAFNVWGARNTLVGNRTGAYASLTELNDAVLIGHRAGDGTAIDDDFIVANSQLTADELIKGNFSTKVMRVEGTELSFRNLPTFADNAAAVAGSHPVGAEYQTATGERRVVV